MMARRGCPKSNIPEVVEETDDEDGEKSNGDLNRTMQTFKRYKLGTSRDSDSSIKSDDEYELKNQNLLEGGMTKQMKTDLLKALAASRLSAVEEDMSRAKSASPDGSLNNDVDKLTPLLNSQHLSDNVNIGTVSPTVNKLLKTDEEKKPVDERKFTNNRSMPSNVFAPDGVDPDKYVEVIFDQLSIHHKCLFAIQRESLNILSWGAPINAVATNFESNSEQLTIKSSSDLTSTKRLQATSSMMEGEIHQPFDFGDKNMTVEIESVSSSESSHEEFLVTKKQKQSKKTVKKLKNNKKSMIKKATNSDDKFECGCVVDVSHECDSVVSNPKEGKPNSFTNFKKTLSLKKRGISAESKAECDTLSKKTKLVNVPLSTEIIDSSRLSDGDVKEAATIIINSQSSGEDNVTCPLCTKQFDKNIIEEHASECMGSAFDNDDESLASSTTTIPITTGPKILNFISTRSCYICGDQFPPEMADNHLAVCNYQNKQKH